jgi:hypothetical protein
MANKQKTIEYVTKQDLNDFHNDFRKELNEDIKIHMGVLYEKFENEVKVVAESHLDIDRKVDKLGFRVSTLTDTVGELNSKVSMLIETVGEIKVDVADIKDGLKNKANLKDYKLLEKRVSVLEATA